MLKGNRDNETWERRPSDGIAWNGGERGKGRRERKGRKEGEREEREEREERGEREAREERKEREAREEILEAKERGGYWRREEKRSIFIKKLHKKGKI